MSSFRKESSDWIEEQVKFRMGKWYRTPIPSVNPESIPSGIIASQTNKGKTFEYRKESRRARDHEALERLRVIRSIDLKSAMIWINNHDQSALQGGDNMRFNYGRSIKPYDHRVILMASGPNYRDIALDHQIPNRKNWNNKQPKLFWRGKPNSSIDMLPNEQKYLKRVRASWNESWWKRYQRERAGLTRPYKSRSMTTIRLLKQLNGGKIDEKKIGKLMSYHQRIKLLEMSKRDKRMDVALVPDHTLFYRKLYEYFEKNYTIVESISPEQFSHYKYQIAVEGFTISSHLPVALKSGSVTMMPEPRWESIFMSGLRPWKHYVPLKMDLTDLKKKLDWCFQHDEDCFEIAVNASEYMKRFNHENEFLINKRVIEKYVENYEDN